MKDTIAELFLSEYFMIRSIPDRYIRDGKELFFGLGKIFLIPENKLNELYSLTEDKKIREICTEKDFMRYRRIKNYSEITGAELIEGGALDEVVCIKGNAILTAANLKLKTDADIPQSVIYANLISAANSGLVQALRIAGILQCEGVFLDRNRVSGIKFLSKSADWNDLVSILALLKYCPETREYNLARLKMAASDTPYGGLYETASKKYKSDAQDEIREVKLLNKAFGSGVLKRDFYDPKYARIIYCRALKFKEKEKAIFTESKEFLSKVAELPLKLTCTDDKLQLSLDGVYLKRKDELESISIRLSNSDLRNQNSFKPLCLCSDSKYLLNMYADAISKAAGVHVERIDAADLTEYDLEPTPNNIFVRSADEDRDNLYLLFVCGDVPEKTVNAVKSFCRSGNRAKFHLNNPSVTIDLREVLPVCFCDGKNAEALGQYCDVLKLKEVTIEEKRTAFTDMLARKRLAYRVAEISVPDEAYGAFEGCDIDNIETVLDNAIRSHRVKGGRVKLTREALKSFLADGRKGVIGFGGAANENR